MKKILSAALAAAVALTSLPLAAAEFEEVVTSGHKIKATRRFDGPYLEYEMRGLKWFFAPEPDSKSPSFFYAYDRRKHNRVWVMSVRGTDDNGEHFANNDKSLMYSVDAHCESWTYDCLSSTFFDGYFGNGQSTGSPKPTLGTVPLPGSVVDFAMTLVCPMQ